MSQPEQKPGRSKQNYATPRNFIEPVKARLAISEFQFDFAAEAENTKAPNYWTKEDNSLAKSGVEWAAQVSGGWGWLNPEFSDIDPWAARCVETKAAGGHVALLVPAGVGANWFRDHVDGHAHVLFLNGRLCFIEDWATTIDPATLKPGKGPPRCFTSEPLYPKDCILCLYSPEIAPGYRVWSWKTPQARKRVA
jgi:phage N-6-adenine-methyltransferase